MNTIKKIYFLALFALATIYSAKAQEIYSLNWDKSQKFKISGGIIYHDTWEVRNDTCSFSSGNILLNKSGKQDLKAQITLRHDGNLTQADVAIVYVFVNEQIVKSFTVVGNEIQDSTLTHEENFSVWKYPMSAKCQAARWARSVWTAVASVPLSPAASAHKLKPPRYRRLGNHFWPQKVTKLKIYFAPFALFCG